jgi:hypothetical protein
MRLRRGARHRALCAAAATAIVPVVIAAAALSSPSTASLRSTANGAGTVPFYFGKLGDVNFGYPAGWRLATSPNSARVTNPRHPAVFMRLSVRTGKAVGSPLEETRVLLRQMRRLRGFTLIRLELNATLQHGEIGAVSTEFTIGRGRARARRRAFFFWDHEGALVRLLFGAPHAGYPRWRPLFARMTASISLDEDE